MTDGIAWPVAYGAFVACAAGVGWLTYVALGRFERPPRRPARRA